MPKVNVISLNIGVNDPKYEAFMRLSAVDKIARIKQRIKDIRLEFKRTAPEATCMFVWREYGIQEAGEEALKEGLIERSVSNKVRRLLKKEMLELVKDDNRLVIIAGSMQIQSPIKDIDHLSKISDLYAFNSVIGEEELRDLYDFDITFTEEELSRLTPEQAIEYKLQMVWHENELFRLIKRPFSTASKVTNSTYIFTHKGYERTDKEAPWFEIPSESKAEHPVIWQPPRRRHVRTRFEYEFAHDPIIFDFANCRALGFKHLFYDSRPIGESKPPIQIIISDWTTVSRDQMQADYVIHVDSLYLTSLFTTTDVSTNPYQVSVYANNLLDDSKELSPVSAQPPETAYADLVEADEVKGGIESLSPILEIIPEDKVEQFLYAPKIAVLSGERVKESKTQIVKLEDEVPPALLVEEDFYGYSLEATLVDNSSIAAIPVDSSVLGNGSTATIQSEFKSASLLGNIPFLMKPPLPAVESPLTSLSSDTTTVTEESSTSLWSELKSFERVSPASLETALPSITPISLFQTPSKANTNKRAGSETYAVTPPIMKRPKKAAPTLLG